MPATRLIAIAFFLGVCGVAQADPWWLEPPPPAIQENQQSAPDAPKDQNPKNEVGETFWERTVSDPVALSTVIIALFTVVLGIGTWVLVLDGRRHSRHALRAYVFADKAWFFDLGRPEGKRRIKAKEGIVGCSVVITNSGETPAYNMIHWGAIALCNPAEQDAVLVVPALDLTQNSNTLAPGGANSKTLFRPGKITPAEIAEVKAGTMLLYLYGRIEYDDIFGWRRYTNYRLSFGYSWPPYGSISLNFSQRGNTSDQNE
ncbi:hypothetical protein [Mesorhizobium huakuii]|uniref:DUF4178 domain-containing protein n=1 Tax=Mesorhizobium huakuii TaxID=28104 RepID=A0ABZ0VPD1_9HYPH|nr:hypothetical protein [Mesorhizobium huakuii]WQB99322.1 hypothetical protein U0R22_003498 [Mesorhizobium huakuii]